MTLSKTKPKRFDLTITFIVKDNILALLPCSFHTFLYAKEKIICVKTPQPIKRGATE